jgi:hypothetical protein
LGYKDKTQGLKKDPTKFFTYSSDNTNCSQNNKVKQNRDKVLGIISKASSMYSKQADYIEIE